MIETLRLRGTSGSVLWGYRSVAELGAWAVIRAPRGPRPRPGVKRPPGRHGWQLQAVIRWRAYDDVLGKRPLYFTAPRANGFWCWPVLEAPQIIHGVLHARLGQPER